MSCPYCPPLEPQQVVRFADDLVMYVDDERWQDALKHSGVIVPVRHAETVFDLTRDELAATFRMLARAKEWLDAGQVLGRSPDGYNVGWNSGAVAGQQVFHAHLHVIPRFAQEPLAGLGIRAHLKGDHNRW